MASPRFSVQEKLALMMTSAGSQRNLAALIGVTHQKVGRWLAIGQTTPSGEPSRTREPTDRGVLAAIDQAFRMHVDVARAQARADHIPFSPDAPVFAYRVTYEDGTPGLRVRVDHAHRMSDTLRARAVTAAYNADFYQAVTAQSVVARSPYWWLAEARIEQEGIRRDPRKEAGRAMWHARGRLTPSDDDDDDYSSGERIALERINTPMTPLDRTLPARAWADDLESKLQVRHAIAVGDKGTELAATLIFQTNTSADTFGAEHDKERRKQYEAKRKREQRARRKQRSQRG